MNLSLDFVFGLPMLKERHDSISGGTWTKNLGAPN